MIITLLIPYYICINYILKELLSVHTSHVQCEEASAEAFKGHKHCGDDLRRNSQSSLREAHGNPNPSSQANALPSQLLNIKGKGLFIYIYIHTHHMIYLYIRLCMYCML